MSDATVEIPGDTEREIYYGSVFPRVAATFLGAEQVLVQFPQTTLLVDHPPIVGGTDLGPNPGDLLDASLAACTAIFVGRNCRRLGIPLESVHVGVAREMSAEAAPGSPLAGSLKYEAAGAPQGDIRWISKMRKRVEVRGPLSADQLEMVEYIANHCALGETLKRGVEIEEEFVHVTDSAEPFDGRTPRRTGHAVTSAGPAAADADCCGGDVCEVPAVEAKTT